MCSKLYELVYGLLWRRFCLPPDINCELKKIRCNISEELTHIGFPGPKFNLNFEKHGNKVGWGSFGRYGLIYLRFWLMFLKHYQSHATNVRIFKFDAMLVWKKKKLVIKVTSERKITSSDHYQRINNML